MDADKDCYGDADEVKNDSVDSDQEPHAEGGKNPGGLCGSDAPTQTEVGDGTADRNETLEQRKVDDDELDQVTKSEVSKSIDLAASQRASRRFSGRLRDKMSNSMISKRGRAGDGEMEAGESKRSSLFSDSVSHSQVNRTSLLSSTESSSGQDMSESRTGQTPSSARRLSVEKPVADIPTVEAYVVVQDDDEERQQQHPDHPIVDDPVEPIFSASIVERKPWYKKTKNVLLLVGFVVVVALSGTIGALAGPRSRMDEDEAVSNIGEGSEVNGKSYNSFSTEKDDLAATTQLPTPGSGCCSRDLGTCTHLGDALCNASKENCEGPCGKHWLENGDISDTCVPLSKTCSTDSDCCLWSHCSAGECDHDGTWKVRSRYRFSLTRLKCALTFARLSFQYPQPPRSPQPASASILPTPTPPPTPNPTTSPSLSSGGYCNWNGCDGVVEGGPWCNENSGNCRNGCGVSFLPVCASCTHNLF